MTLPTFVDIRRFLFVCVAFVAMIFLPRVALAQRSGFEPASIFNQNRSCVRIIGTVRDAGQHQGMFRVEALPGCHAEDLLGYAAVIYRRDRPSLTTGQVRTAFLAVNGPHLIRKAYLYGRLVQCRFGVSRYNSDHGCMQAMPPGFDPAHDPVTDEAFCSTTHCTSIEDWSVTGDPIDYPLAYGVPPAQLVTDAQSAVQSRLADTAATNASVITSAAAMDDVVITHVNSLGRQTLVATIQLDRQAMQRVASTQPQPTTAGNGNAATDHTELGSSNSDPRMAELQTQLANERRAHADDVARLRQAHPSRTAIDWRAILGAVLGMSLTFVVTRKVYRRDPGPFAPVPAFVATRNVPQPMLSNSDVAELKNLREDKKDLQAIVKQAWEKAYPNSDRKMEWGEFSLRCVRDLIGRLYDLEMAWPYKDKPFSVENFSSLIAEYERLRPLAAVWTFEDHRPLTNETLKALIADWNALQASNQKNGDHLAEMDLSRGRELASIREQLASSQEVARQKHELLTGCHKRAKDSEAANHELQARLDAAMGERDHATQEYERLEGENHELRLELTRRPSEPLKQSPFARLTLPGTPDKDLQHDPSSNGNGSGNGGDAVQAAPSFGRDDEDTQVNIRVPPRDLPPQPIAPFAPSLSLQPPPRQKGEDE